MDTFTLVEGSIEGALFAIAVPVAEWNGGVLIFAHGCRPAGIPLMADLNVGDRLYQRLLTQGWMVACTSYRRENIIVRDAVEDVFNLHAYISEVYGKPTLSILEGCSMGGCISVHCSERLDCPFDGIMALGAALLAHDPVGRERLFFSHSPSKPLLFITNSDETTLIERYQHLCIENGSGVIPATWTVFRNGHDNVNSLEREQGILFLLQWISSGGYPDEARMRGYDATMDMPIRATSDLFFDDEGAWGRVTHVDAWGDIWTNVTPADLDKLEIGIGKQFNIELGAKRYLDRGLSVKARRIHHFLGAGQGDWCGYDSAEGFLIISRNGYAQMHRACDDAHVGVGAAVHILRPVGVGAKLSKIPSKLIGRFLSASGQFSAAAGSSEAAAS